METGDLPQKPLLGIISADPLRALGLETILGELYRFHLIDLRAPGALRRPGLDMILLDSSATDQLLSLLEIFGRDEPTLRLIVLGPESDHDHIERIIGAGAKGYLTYSASEDELRLALEIVGSGSVWAPRIVMARLVERNRRLGVTRPMVAPSFTPRELQVLHLLVEGQPNREIAHALGVDEGTVKAHIGRLMRKLGVANRTALTVQAIERKLWRSVNS